MTKTQIAINKKNKMIGKDISISNDTNIYMVNFRGVICDKFSNVKEASKSLNKTEVTIYKYLKNENRFDGIHFLCRRKV